MGSRVRSSQPAFLSLDGRASACRVPLVCSGSPRGTPFAVREYLPTGNCTAHASAGIWFPQFGPESWSANSAVGSLAINTFVLSTAKPAKVTYVIPAQGDRRHSNQLVSIEK